MALLTESICASVVVYCEQNRGVDVFIDMRGGGTPLSLTERRDRCELTLCVLQTGRRRNLRRMNARPSMCSGLPTQFAAPSCLIQPLVILVSSQFLNSS